MENVNRQRLAVAVTSGTWAVRLLIPVSVAYVVALLDFDATLPAPFNVLIMMILLAGTLGCLGLAWYSQVRLDTLNLHREISTLIRTELAAGEARMLAAIATRHEPATAEHRPLRIAGAIYAAGGYASGFVAGIKAADGDDDDGAQVIPLDRGRSPRP